MRVKFIISIVLIPTLMCCSSRKKSGDSTELFIIEKTEDVEMVENDVWATSEPGDPPILKSKSPVISVQDGSIAHKNSWTVSPYLELDEFVTRKFKGEKIVRFYSDIDTISFEVQPNKKYDFVVFLNNGEKAYNQINTDTTKAASFGKQKVLSYHYEDNNNTALSDTIPFKIGNDHRIHLAGKVNNSSPLDFVFDTGANSIVIASSLVGEKVNMLIDGETMNGGSGGIKSTSTSSTNKLAIEHLVWDSIKILSINYEKPTFDGVLGWTAFENKVVEIDYEKKLFIIHEELVEIPSDYSKMETKMILGIPFIKGSVTVNNEQSVGWFEYDTGSSGSFNISQSFAKRHQLNNAMEITGTSIGSGSTGAKWTSNNYILPKLRLGEFEISQVPITIRSEDPEGVGYLDIMGNNLLKRFNAIIDFRKKIIYLKPNNLNYQSH